MHAWMHICMHIMNYARLWGLLCINAHMCIPKCLHAGVYIPISINARICMRVRFSHAYTGSNACFAPTHVNTCEHALPPPYMCVVLVHKHMRILVHTIIACLHVRTVFTHTQTYVYASSNALSQAYTCVCALPPPQTCVLPARMHIHAFLHLRMQTMHTYACKHYNMHIYVRSCISVCIHM